MNIIDKVLGTFGIGFNIKTEIFEERANNAVILKDDRARKIYEDGVDKYFLFKENRTITAPKFSNIFTTGGGKPRLKLFKAQTGQYQFVNFMRPMTLKAEDKDTRFWYTQEKKAAAKAYEDKSNWEKYMPYIMLTLMGTMIFMQVLFFYRGMGAMTAGMNSAAGKFITAAEKLTNFNNILG